MFSSTAVEEGLTFELLIRIKNTKDVTLELGSSALPGASDLLDNKQYKTIYYIVFGVLYQLVNRQFFHNMLHFFFFLLHELSMFIKHIGPTLLLIFNIV